MPAMSYVVVDAGIWVARLVPQDDFYENSKTWLARQRAAGIELVSSSLLLTEVAGVISRRTGDARPANRAVKSVNTLPGLHLVQMDDQLVHQAARLAAEPGLPGADSLYVAVAQQLHITLATLDGEQKNRAAKVVKAESING